MSRRDAPSSARDSDERADEHGLAGPVVFAAAPVGRRRRSVSSVVVVAVVAIVLVVAVVKPWGGSQPPPDLGGSPAGPSLAPAAAVPAGGIEQGISSLGDAAAYANEAAGFQSPPDPDILALIVQRLSKTDGAWGVGVGGEGPRLIRDDPWTEWMALDPVTASASPYDLARWPGTPLCAGVPEVLTRPSIVAVTVPDGLAADWRIDAWRSDGVTTTSLADSVIQVSPPGNRTISYLEYPDNIPWPDGRYEFHIVSGDHTLAMSICLSRLV